MTGVQTCALPISLREKRCQAQPEEDVSPTVEGHSYEETAAVPLEECVDRFWEAGEALNSFSVHPALPEVDNAVLKRLGDAPYAVGKHNVASLLARAYTVASSDALKLALDEPRGEE